MTFVGYSCTVISVGVVLINLARLFMNEENIYDLFFNRKLHCGRIIAAHKTSPRGQVCVWNANIITKSSGKLWFGDLNITKEGSLLKEIAVEIGETLYVLRESDCRFGTEKDPIDLLISRAVWNTDMEIPYE